ncbi:MAG: Uma2 family endonuclease [SAR324 cluster bacterium]|nr:Uma2 family endonuclease [SAR324 cluster bacterium]
MLATQKKTDIVYPETDGKPMAETDTHRILLLRAADLLQNAFPQAYVSGNICLYYEEGNPRKMISPDSLLCRQQPPHAKRVYLAWEEESQLDLVMEFSSFSTRRMDHHHKKQIYEQILKVPYYVIFDPHAIYLNVFESRKGKYHAVEANEKGMFFLEKLGIYVGLETEGLFRLFNQHQYPIPTSIEREAQRAEQEAQRAEQEAQRAEQEAQRAEQEAQRADTAEKAVAEEKEKTARARQAETSALNRAETVEKENEALRRELELLRQNRQT